MYCACINEKVVAIHDDVEVIEEYVKLYEHYHEDANIKIGKIKNKKAAIYDDLYLEMVGNAFVQSKYVESFTILRRQMAEDTKRARNVLERLLVEEDMSKSEKKHLTKTIEFLESLIYEDEMYTPTEEELEYNKDQIDQVLNKIYWR